jgi:mycothiol S-conjugate amidase
VRTIEPDVIVSYNDFGGYGHPDHIRAALLAKAAFERAGDPAAFPDQLSGPAALRPWTPLKLYELVTVTGHSRGHRVMRLVREQGLAALPTLVGVAARWRPRAERARSRVASAEGRTTTRVDIAPWLELKHRALAEHRSQISPTHPYLALTTRERRAVSPTEDFTVRLSRIVVHPPEDDLFAGLR